MDRAVMKHKILMRQSFIFTGRQNPVSAVTATSGRRPNTTRPKPVCLYVTGRKRRLHRRRVTEVIANRRRNYRCSISLENNYHGSRRGRKRVIIHMQVILKHCFTIWRTGPCPTCTQHNRCGERFRVTVRYAHNRTGAGAGSGSRGGGWRTLPTVFGSDSEPLIADLVAT